MEAVDFEGDSDPEGPVFCAQAHNVLALRLLRQKYGPRRLGSREPFSMPNLEME